MVDVIDDISILTPAEQQRRNCVQMARRLVTKAVMLIEKAVLEEQYGTPLQNTSRLGLFERQQFTVIVNREKVLIRVHFRPRQRKDDAMNIFSSELHAAFENRYPARTTKCDFDAHCVTISLLN